MNEPASVNHQCFWTKKYVAASELGWANLIFLLDSMLNIRCEIRISCILAFVKNKSFMVELLFSLQINRSTSSSFEVYEISK